MSVFFPFDMALVESPTMGQNFLATGLTHTPALTWQPFLTIVDPWRPRYLQAKKSGFTCLQTMPEHKKNYSGALLQLGKHKGYNKNCLLDLLARVEPGGLVVLSGDKTCGAASMVKWLQEYLTLEDKLAKNHAITCWFRVPHKLQLQQINALRVKSTSFTHDCNNHLTNTFTTSPGMFSHGRIDQGSALLQHYFGKQIFGHIADFGAGWGYLSTCLLKQQTKMTKLDLFEADYNALQAAKQHIAAAQTASKTSIPVRFFWHDIAHEPINAIYDTVISNPPFHEGRKADTTLGQRFIAVAAARLKPGGHLLLVANKHLPYEGQLRQHFKSFITLDQKDGFKVLCAKRAL